MTRSHRTPTPADVFDYIHYLVFRNNLTSVLFWAAFIAWNIVGVMSGIFAIGGGGPSFHAAWHSPFMHLMYLTPGYWLITGAAAFLQSPFWSWFTGA